MISTGEKVTGERRLFGDFDALAERNGVFGQMDGLFDVDEMKETDLAGKELQERALSLRTDVDRFLEDNQRLLVVSCGHEGQRKLLPEMRIVGTKRQRSFHNLFVRLIVRIFCNAIKERERERESLTSGVKLWAKREQ